MPGGALIYLESSNFGGLLRDWDDSKVKADWLESANYEVFSRSNLFTKLNEVYGQYGEAAGFLPDVKSMVEIAGTDSALALYGIRDVEFLYITRIADANLLKSQLWAVRDKFEQRQAGGVAFYLRTDAASKRTVAFAFAKGYLLLATRDDLVAQSLELLAGGANPSIASDRWYRDASDAGRKPRGVADGRQPRVRREERLLPFLLGSAECLGAEAVHRRCGGPHEVVRRHHRDTSLPAYSRVRRARASGGAVEPPAVDPGRGRHLQGLRHCRFGCRGIADCRQS